MRRIAITLTAGLALLAACNRAPEVTATAPAAAPAAPVPPPDGLVAMGREMARQFVTVVAAIEPVAEARCREVAPDIQCDFRFVIDDRAGLPPNAYQTLDSYGRPVVAFTIALLGTLHNRDELAFVMAHETAHHILGHRGATATAQWWGGYLGGQLAGELVPGAGALGNYLGTGAGARAFSKRHEREADEMAVLLAFRAGFDPWTGAQFLGRAADPGNVFLGTHPSNGDRLDDIAQAVRRL